MYAELSLEFLRGTAKTDECEPLFRQYKQCLDVSGAGSYRKKISALMPDQKALKERGIDKMLEEAMDNNKEHDAENMLPK